MILKSFSLILNLSYILERLAVDKNDSKNFDFRQDNELSIPRKCNGQQSDKIRNDIINIQTFEIKCSLKTIDNIEIKFDFKHRFT